MPEYPLDISSGHKHVAELAHAIAFYGEKIREAITLSNEIGDAGTADLLTQVTRGTDMNLCSPHGTTAIRVAVEFHLTLTAKKSVDGMSHDVKRAAAGHQRSLFHLQPGFIKRSKRWKRS